MSYAKALKEGQCQNVETTIRKRRPLLAGAVQRTTNERLARRVMFVTIAGGENPGPGRPEKNWAQCLADDLRVFQATEGSTENSPLLFGPETVLWPRTAKKSGMWYRGVVEVGFMTRWRTGKAKRKLLRHAVQDAKSGNKGTGGGSRTDAALDECRNELIDRLARHRSD